MKQTLLFFAIILALSSFATAQTYHEDDKEGLRMFLLQPSSIAGEINAQRVGLQISDTLNWLTQENWVVKVLKLKWSNSSPKRITEIDWSGNFFDPNATNLSGNLDCSKWLYLSGVLRCNMNELTSLIVNNCPNLITIGCSYNKLTTLSVSNCPNLTKFFCDNNQIAIITIDNCPALLYLSCRRNKLTTMDLSHCMDLDCGGNLLSTFDMNITNLEVLGCNGNLLKFINLSINPALKNLDCGGNFLTNIDLSKNLALQELNCWSNQLTSLDLTANTSLSILNCNSNPLTSLQVPASLGNLSCVLTTLPTLDVSHCKKLSELDCRMSELTTLNVNHCEALKNLNCQNNQLETLDLSDCKSLSYLDCNNNLLTSIQANNLSSLCQMWCNNNQLTHLDVSNNTALEILYCRNNLLKTLDITNCISLVDLDCRYNNLNALDISTNKVLHALWCNNNQFYFSGLPSKLPVPWGYVYWPQDTIEGGKIYYDAGIDLSKEYSVEGYFTQFFWFDITDGEETPLELEGVNGFFSLTEDYINKRLRCKMTNAAFPYLTGNNILVYEVTIKQFCEAVNNLEAEKQNNNSILLTWSKPESNLTVEGYSVYRNEQLQNNELLTVTSYLDKNILDGKYEYYVETHYTNGCISEKSNIVTEMIGVGIKPITNYELRITVYPNPTSGVLKIGIAGQARNDVRCIEVFDVYGRTVGAKFPSNELEGWQPQADGVVLNISNLKSGIYFVRIETENGSITKKW
jgi:Leucine-rich repeat (LRR) protein